jgi:ATP-dependent Clp protease ATP-binding subunit ClpC
MHGSLRPTKGTETPHTIPFLALSLIRFTDRLNAQAMFVFERFTQGAIKSIMLAQEEARRLGHNYVDTEQLLLGLIGEGTGIASSSLKAHGVNLKRVRILVEEKIGKGDNRIIPWYQWWQYFSTDSSRQMPFKPRAIKVLEFSWEEAQVLNHNFIGTEHLMLGLLREANGSLGSEDTQGVAVQALQSLNVDLDLLHKKTLQLIKERD